MSDDETPATDPRVTAAREFCTFASEFWSKQRKREDEDLAFQVPELQWTDEAKKRFAGSSVNGVTSPPRPMLSISKIDQPIQLVLNQERQAHLGVQIHPLDEQADDDTAEVLQDLYRGIERESFAELARTWGYERGVKAGLGNYRIIAEFADEVTEGPGIHDQKIVIKRVLDQRCTLFDPFAQEPDWSDGQRALVYDMVPFDTYKRLYPKSKLADFNALDFEEMTALGEGWASGEDSSRAVRVADSYYITYEEQTLSFGGKSRLYQKPVVNWCKVNGIEVLEETIVPGKYIPLIPVIGQELQPFDGERRFFGIIARAKDPQRLLNIEVSNAVNKDALSARTQWLVAEGQMEGYEHFYEMSATHNLVALPYKPTSHQGNLVGPPQRMLESPDLSSSLLLIAQANDYIQATTATYDPSLGKQAKGNKPAKAILAEQQQSEQGNSNYLDNLARAMRHEARVILGMIPAIYDRPGRIVRGVDGEDNEREVMLNQPYYVDPKTQRPVGLKEGQQPPAGANGKPAKVLHYDLKKGTYGVNVSIGKSHRSRMEAGADGLGQVLQAAPELMPILGPTWLNFQDWPGAKEAADLLKKMQPPQLQKSGDGEQPSTEELQAQNDQLKQMIEAAKQEMDAMRQALETKQIEQQGKIAAEQAKGQTTAQIEAMKAEHDADKIAIQGQIDAMLLKLEYALKGQLQDDQQSHDAGMAGADAQHASGEAEAGREHEANMGRQQAETTALSGHQSHQQAIEQVDRGHQQTLEQGEADHQRGMESQTQAESAAEKQAKLKPKPEAKK